MNWSAAMSTTRTDLNAFREHAERTARSEREIQGTSIAETRLGLPANPRARGDASNILVNNAAFQEPAERIEELTEAHFDRTIKTNLYG
jgi:NAD(P)-dependent dehydrogenase (short-subunit alcohol dehydrogenase family)